MNACQQLVYQHLPVVLANIVLFYRGWELVPQKKIISTETPHQIFADEKYLSAYNGKKSLQVWDCEGKEIDHLHVDYSFILFREGWCLSMEPYSRYTFTKTPLASRDIEMIQYCWWTLHPIKITSDEKEEVLTFLPDEPDRFIVNNGDIYFLGGKESPVRGYLKKENRWIEVPFQGSCLDHLLVDGQYLYLQSSDEKTGYLQIYSPVEEREIQTITIPGKKIKSFAISGKRVYLYREENIIEIYRLE